MPPALIGAAFVSLGASAATGAAVTAIATTVYIGAAAGALIGGVTAAIKGEDIIKGAVRGAVRGAVIGGVVGGIGGALSLAVGGTSAATGAAAIPEAGLIPPAGVVDPVIGVGSAGVPAVGAAGTPAPAAVAPGGSGILNRASGAMKYLADNPELTKVAAGTVGGAAKGVLAGRSKRQELEAEMEQNRLQLEASQIRGLSTMDLKVVLPDVGEFAKRPAWQMPDAGIIGRAKDAA